MSYLKKYQWELVPKNLPIVRRNCPKCNEKVRYINSEKFRVNANKNSIDIWLIYQCEKCKSTWNMAIYERIKPYDINKYEYEKFLSNDKELAREYAFDLSIYNKNKAEVILEGVNYKLIQKKLEAYYKNENELVIEIVCNDLIELRVDKLLSDTLGISRNKIKNMNKKGVIFIKDNKNSLNMKVRDRMEIHVLNVVENIGILETII
ncbi:DUF1062 domain-containing protein [Clostridium saccharobutylicum]|uniref:Uncharacterized protein n=1 Tax=Clostridium saccharobutylicum DSM 13864 TaxID=1345695 RepID=U5MUT8_CLOSA|nr:DUF1062 domain-containing protein [Clostridium saccharobutylicum]AGX44544.1 hypothetical protein CLSA_c35830 [Clostridium saccharobutylicum DSM 13864]AQR91835.1 hypothetical protein CLOSC_35630 [Clostridium saccharobutylicum]AQS01737.1 hypothetical protein CSACC_35680 [Clostridium saccharobutylicum]AQS15720.1 hypothetical protein CLOSACC_35680 [Clostridium saccharobutylicum]MBA2906592.1 hypothetical protein [Clostridium saccharobutylicum]